MSEQQIQLFNEPPKKESVFSYRPFWRARWWFLAPLFLFGLSSYVVAELWPLLYRSDALIVIEGQKIPEQYVTPNVVSTLRFRLASMRERILSRTRLQQIIDEFGLYGNERSHMSMDDVVDYMRKNITVELAQTKDQQDQQDVITGIRISYAANDPRTAQRVTNQITSMFIDDSLRSRTQESLSTTAFLTNQLEQARKDLQVQEARLRSYKSQFIGELPQQEQSNLQILSGLENQLYTVSSALARADQQRVYLEAMRAQYARPDGSPKLSPQEQKNAERMAAEEALGLALREYEDAKMRYTDEHPRITQLKQQIADWRKHIAELDKRSDEQDDSAPASPAETALADIQSRLKAASKEIADYTAAEQRLQQRIKEMQTRIGLIPLREQQLADVNRMYEDSKANYESLLQRKTQSELASNLETRQQGEQFRLLDPASLPQRPEGRILIVIVGWAAGLYVGVGLLVLRTKLDKTIHGKEDIAAVTDLPILARIPRIITSRKTAYNRGLRFAEAMVVISLIVSAVAGAARVYLTT